jgi:hypothetical protein
VEQVVGLASRQLGHERPAPRHHVEEAFGLQDPHQPILDQSLAGAQRTVQDQPAQLRRDHVTQGQVAVSDEYRVRGHR